MKENCMRIKLNICDQYGQYSAVAAVFRNGAIAAVFCCSLQSQNGQNGAFTTGFS